MRRLLGLGALALVASIGLSACDASFAPFAARVNGKSISNSALARELDSFASDGDLVCVLASQQSSGISIGGNGEGSFDSGFAASRLSALIDAALVTSALGQLHLSVTSTATAVAVNELGQILTPAQGSSCTATGSAVVAGLPTQLTGSIVHALAGVDALAAHLAGGSLTADGIASYQQANPVTSAEQCVSAIVVTTAASASSLRQAIVRGAPFSVVAKTNSIDTSSAPNGGVLGCYPLARFSSPLDATIAKLAIGQVSPVVALNGDFVLVVVTSRTPGTASDVAEAMVDSGLSAETTYVNRLAANASVSVDSSVGTWGKVDGSFEVVPRSGPADTLLTNAAALTPAVISTAAPSTP